jgi:hypothetical protein
MMAPKQARPIGKMIVSRSRCAVPSWRVPCGRRGWAMIVMHAAGGSSALATIANAFTRVLPDDEALFHHLESALVLMPPSAFDAETLAVVW